jgi:hypothetical protein
MPDVFFFPRSLDRVTVGLQPILQPNSLRSFPGFRPELQDTMLLDHAQHQVDLRDRIALAVLKHMPAGIQVTPIWPWSRICITTSGCTPCTVACRLVMPGRRSAHMLSLAWPASCVHPSRLAHMSRVKCVLSQHDLLGVPLAFDQLERRPDHLVVSAGRRASCGRPRSARRGAGSTVRAAPEG